MAIELKQQKKGVTHLAIQGELTIYSVLEHKEALFPYLSSAKEIQIDLADVTEIDSAGLQLLMFLKQEAVSRGITFSLSQHSEAVVEVLELLNLSKHFGDPIVISADWKSS
ncbi:STAS domain protein [Methylomonas albis]|uniref:STAS domain-containing protein n=1 Tax=Methylomonas albis TaxID=1854563 RepID=A0ABR9D1S4_9GAMM|nr:STAS domain-containing protein [Methylomonas albis]MBD9356985.1 STAS domain-containing protein [Methylomonas albis]CAD6880178.1 STAS domain protein [Methylomonas albis]